MTTETCKACQVCDADALCLRAMEPEDLNLVFEVENSREAFVCGDTRMPFSYAFLREYIAKSLKESFCETGQVRLKVERTSVRSKTGKRSEPENISERSEPVGILDIFNHDPFSHRAEIGIIVLPAYRARGFGRKILELACNYAKNTLNLHQLYAEVLCTNTASLRLFEEAGFERCALKRDWHFASGRYIDVTGFQRLLK